MMKILEERQIKQKITRLAYQIAEQNYQADEILLLGINNNGLGFAKLILKQLKKVAKCPCSASGIRLNPANPLDYPVTFEKPLPESLRNKVMIIVDDVSNTGRTIFYAFKPLMELLPHKLEVAVLVDRKHKLFPIHVDYVGLSLATTMRENISVKLEKEDTAVYMD